MTTQLNLLPDVKLEYIKAQRSRRMAISIALLVSIIAVALLVLLLAAEGLQKKHLDDLKRDVATYSSTLKNEPQIAKVLTVQNQLESLTSLHSSKPAASNLFGYLNEVTPANVNIADFKIDFTQDTATITGAADSLSSVNQYVDTLKLTTFSTKQDPTSQPAFSNVVLGSFSLSSDSQASDGHPADYSITMSYDSTLFDITQAVTLTVPSLTTPRSAVAQPADLFQASPAPSGTNKGGN